MKKTTGQKNKWLVHEEESTSYEDCVQGPDQPRMTKVSVTVDRGLLSLVDHFVENHQDISRSEVFDLALEMWAKQTQKQADIDCYGKKTKNPAELKAAEDWDAIQTEALRNIW